MQNMQKIGIIVISVVLIGLIIFVALYDSVVDKTVLKINGEKYTMEDFNNFMNLVELERGEEVDAKEVYEQYIDIKLYHKKAVEHGLTLSEEEIKSIEENYESEEVNKEALSALGFTKEEYIKYISDSMLASKFINSAYEYYPISDDVYEEYKKQYAEILKTYNYRIMHVAHEIPEDSEDQTVTDEIKQATKAKIEAAVERVKAGEDFETVAKECGSYRITQGLSGYTIINNGQLESMPLVYLQYSVPDEALYTELIQLEAGNCTNIVEDSAGYTLAKLESIEEELSEEAETKIKNDLGASNAQQYILSTTEIIEYYSKVKNVKHVDFDTLPVNEVENADDENETPSISVEEVVDGENAEETENTESETTAE